MEIDYSSELFAKTKQTLAANGCDPKQASLSHNKTDDTIKFFNKVAIRIQINKKGKFFYVADNFVDYVKTLYSADYSVANARFPFNSLEDFDNRFNEIIVFIYKTFHEQLIADEFSCCSQYLECSNNKACVNDRKDNNGRKFSAGCHYKQHLDKGVIFYGKNATI